MPKTKTTTKRTSARTARRAKLTTSAEAPRGARAAPAATSATVPPTPRTWHDSPGFPWFPADERELAALATTREAAYFFIWRATQQWATLAPTQRIAIVDLALCFESPNEIAHAIGRLLVEALRGGEPEIFRVAVAAYKALPYDDRRHLEDRLTGEPTFADRVIRAHEDDFEEPKLRAAGKGGA